MTRLDISDYSWPSGAECIKIQDSGELFMSFMVKEQKRNNPKLNVWFCLSAHKLGHPIIQDRCHQFKFIMIYRSLVHMLQMGFLEPASEMILGLSLSTNLRTLL